MYHVRIGPRDGCEYVGKVWSSSQLYSGSEDSTVRAWSVDANEYVAALQEHTGGVSCLRVHNNKLYSGSWDKTIRAWNLDTNECITALQGHTAVSYTHLTLPTTPYV